MQPFDRSTKHSPMKTNSWLVLTMALTSPCLNAQLSLPLGTTAPTVVETGPHHRTWQTVKVGLDQRGQQVMTTNSYVELATGMNILSEGRWVPASDEIELVNAARSLPELKRRLFSCPTSMTPPHRSICSFRTAGPFAPKSSASPTPSATPARAFLSANLKIALGK